MAAATSNTQFGCTYGSCASVAVVEVLEQYSDIDPHDSEFRLYDVIDPDALDNLFSRQQTRGLSVDFDIDDVTVSISQANDDIQIEVTDIRE